MGILLEGHKVMEECVKDLQSKSNFDRVSSENKRPKSVNFGLFNTKIRDSAQDSNDGDNCDIFIIPDAPNFYKQNGASVSNSYGLFQFSRLLFSDPRYQGAPIKYQKVLLILMGNAAFAPTTHGIGVHLVKIGIGQFCVSERRLIDLCNHNVKFEDDKVDKNIIRRAIAFFKKCGFVNQEVNHGKSIITLTIPVIYESNKLGSEPQSEPKVNQKRTTKEEDKEIKEDKDIYGESAIAPSKENNIIISSPPKKPKIQKPPLIERAENIWVSEEDHQKLILSKGEQNLNLIYSAMTNWKSENDITRKTRGDAATAERWQLSTKKSTSGGGKPKITDAIPKSVNSDLEARKAKGGAQIDRVLYEKIVKKADRENRPEDKQGYIIHDDPTRTMT